MRTNHADSGQPASQPRTPLQVCCAAPVLLALYLLSGRSAEGETWAEALAAMPLPPGTHELNATNCVPLMLLSLRSNTTVKALVFMPGATDEFFLFHRARAVLRQNPATLLDAIGALTNQTHIAVEFRPPFVLLYTTEDVREPLIGIVDQATAQRLQANRSLPHLLYADRDWDVVQPELRHALHVGIRPWKGSTDSWHFYRHCFAGWNLTGWEALECAALAGKSQFHVLRHQVVFEPDERIGGTVRFESRAR
jgi:hypothetical protein